MESEGRRSQGSDRESCDSTVEFEPRAHTSPFRSYSQCRWRRVPNRAASAPFASHDARIAAAASAWLPPAFSVSWMVE
eukprot:7378869-Prymnesium_polylepis.2